MKAVEKKEKQSAHREAGSGCDGCAAGQQADSGAGGNSLCGEGAVVGSRYRLLRMIGKGGSARVWLAEDLVLQKKWAVKQSRFFDSGMLSEEQQMLAACDIKREAEILKKLSHPMIPGIRDVFEEDGRVYVVMDYVEGITLEEYRKTKGPVPEKLVRRWAVDLCRVLYYLHTRTPPVIYRDLKPSNIMLTPGGHIRLIDFGIAREYREGKTADTAILGTTGYAAPEQHGRRQSDARCDIYSLGITLWELLTGQPPLEDSGEIRRYSREESGGVISGEMERILRRATSYDSRDRYPDCRRMALDLLESEGRIKEQRKKKQRRILCRLAAGLMAVLFLICTAVYLSVTGHARELQYRNYLDFGAVTGAGEAVVRAEKAVRIHGDREEVYDHLLRYMEERTFGDKESRAFTRFWKTYRESIADQSFYAELLLRIGKLYFYRYRGEDDSLRVRILRSEPYFASAVSCEHVPEAIRKESEAYETVCTFCLRYVFDTSMVREPTEKEYRKILEALEGCIGKVDGISGEEAVYSKLTLLAEMGDILNSLRFGMAKAGVSDSRIAKLYRDFLKKVQSLHPTRKKTEAMQEELMENLSVYLGNLERAYRNAADE